MSANVPFFNSQTGSQCDSKLTISGMKTASCKEDQARQAAGPAVQMRLAGALVDVLSTWDWSAMKTTTNVDTVVVTPGLPLGTLLAGQEYELQFEVVNPTSAQDRMVYLTKNEAPQISQFAFADKYLVETGISNTYYEKYVKYRI